MTSLPIMDSNPPPRMAPPGRQPPFPQDGTPPPNGEQAGGTHPTLECFPVFAILLLSRGFSRSGNVCTLIDRSGRLELTANEGMFRVNFKQQLHTTV